MQRKVRVFLDRKEFVVGKGEVQVIPSNIPNRFEGLEETVDIEVFSPLRQDWLSGTDTIYQN